jgi:hypothetical protein
VYILCNFQLGEKTKDPIIIVTSPKKPITCDLFFFFLGINMRFVFFFFGNKHAICFGSGKSVIMMMLISFVAAACGLDGVG